MWYYPNHFLCYIITSNPTLKIYRDIFNTECHTAAFKHKKLSYVECSLILKLGSVTPSLKSTVLLTGVMPTRQLGTTVTDIQIYIQLFVVCICRYLPDQVLSYFLQKAMKISHHIIQLFIIICRGMMTVQRVKTVTQNLHKSILQTK